ncbi:MAG: hypothetical protein HC802_14225 [Caldilineaceae bacterium]|nr:hypothetical protein [Caldilineaceae bacterium]
MFEVGLYRPSGEGAGDRIGIIDGSGNIGADKVDFGVVALGIDPPQADLSDLRPMQAGFEGQVELSGWRANRDPSDPQRLGVDLGWTALDRADTDYTAFVHLLDGAGNIVSQQDHPPGSVDNPTKMWLPEERIRSTFELALPVSTALNNLMLRIGLYEPVSGRQLPVTHFESESGEAGSTFILLPLDLQ